MIKFSLLYLVREILISLFYKLKSCILSTEKNIKFIVKIYIYIIYTIKLPLISVRETSSNRFQK